MILLLVIPAIYIMFVLESTRRWRRIPTVGLSRDSVNSFSILIPFRNEEERLGLLIESLKAIHYPADQFEVIFINDHSSDDGSALLESVCEHHSNWKVVSLLHATGKKSALKKGIEEANHPIIITTDADCVVGADWLNAYDRAYAKSGTHMVAGTIQLFYKRPSLPVIFQVFEQYGLTGLSGVTMHAGHPTMCNGANLSFRKEAFMAVNGYEGNENVPGGDDQFLLQKISKKFECSVLFMKDAVAAVGTQTVTSWDEMMQQRVRWAAKWKSTGRLVSFLAVFVALTYFSLFASLFFLHDDLVLHWLPVILLAKLCADAFFVAVVAGRSIDFRTFIYWPIIQVIYPFYTLFVVWKSIRGNYIWKDRMYSSAV